MAAAMHTPVPDIPGTVIEGVMKHGLMQHLNQLLGLDPSFSRFPGSQPVSFVSRSLKLLETRNFWVCEKSDGVRVMMLIAWNSAENRQQVFLIDRKNTYKEVENLEFPHWNPPSGIKSPCGPSVIDGELVCDIDRKTGEQRLRLYAFDCIVYSNTNLMKSSLQSRYGRLKSWLLEPFHKNLREQTHPAQQPFEIVCKTMELAEGIEAVVKDHIPQLEHGHDGLIFTCAETGYVIGTDEMILKWKPPLENSIDFKLELRFPPTAKDANMPDYTVKPMFVLLTNMGRNYDFFDTMVVTDAEWEAIKESGVQWDERIVECHWDPEYDSWRFMRFRDDKTDGNHWSVVQKIIESIRDGVELETLIARAPIIYARRKERAAMEQQKPRYPAPPPPMAMGGPPIPQRGAPQGSYPLPNIQGGYGMSVGGYGPVGGGGLRR
ncbi:hypothetical protein QFC21_006033 [Naganishia friedmannii]|uniref:Uncharacterized protein n=1 Tax=Naganishia friedmannii TaxID=89922 RepID=A0ACC2V573_9TREE|nr:hypothetical protein QFC21_006033 [Naganishia friedmannii]